MSPQGDPFRTSGGFKSMTTHIVRCRMLPATPSMMLGSFGGRDDALRYPVARSIDSPAVEAAAHQAIAGHGVEVMRRDVELAAAVMLLVQIYAEAADFCARKFCNHDTPHRCTMILSTLRGTSRVGAQRLERQRIVRLQRESSCFLQGVFRRNFLRLAFASTEPLAA